MMLKTTCKFTLILLFLSFSIISQSDAYEPKDFEMEIQTKGIQGAKAKLTARLDAPVEAVWNAILDSNNHAGKYPRLKRSFCMSESDVAESKKKGLRNGNTVDRHYRKKKCQPAEMRQKGQVWNYHIYQEFDYPFPLADRWIMAKAHNDESGLKKKRVRQKGELIYGRQDIYEFELSLSPAPKHPNQTILEMTVWTDPGGLIADWMIEQATKYVAPDWMEALEREGQRWNKKN